MSSNEYDLLDQGILQTIPRIREEHYACTARAVASTLGASPDVVKYRCQKLRDDGLVIWTDMVGSLRLLEVEVEEADDADVPPVESASPPLEAAQAADLPVIDATAHADAPVSPPESATVQPAATPKPAPRRKPAAKKAAAKRAPRSS